MPGPAAQYCLKLYNYYGFEFRIKKARQTKLGDYRFDPAIKKHVITINNDLNPYAFLITYLHEVAHLITYDEYGRSVNPHGDEWKNNFRKVSQPVLSSNVFPEPVYHTFKNYLKNPKAASCSDPVLHNLLKKFDRPNGKVMLSSLHVGDSFVFNSKAFRYLEKKRTRILAQDLNSKRKYMISQLAEVKKLPGD